MPEDTREFVTRPIGGEFGTSVTLDRLQDVIDYEEGRIRPTHGYPRFVAHPEVAKRERFARTATGMPFSLAFPSLDHAQFILNDFILRHHPDNGLFALSPDALVIMSYLHPGKKSARFFRGRDLLMLVAVDGLQVACIQHEEDYQRLLLLRRTWGSGFDVHGLAAKPVAPKLSSEAALVKTLCGLEGDKGVGAHLFQSGMAALASLAVWAVQTKRRLVLIGPAYVDTGTIVGKWPTEIPLLDTEWLGEDFSREDLAEALEKGPALVLMETPTNPRLTVPDIPLVMETAKGYDAVLAVDATVATPYNFKALDAGFDIVVHSTTKFLGGRYDHLGGVVITKDEEILQAIGTIRNAAALGMCQNQMATLEARLRDFPDRMERINANAQEIVERLQRHHQVAEVYYPGIGGGRGEALSNALFNPGRSGLLSFLLKDDSQEALERFYDNVKAPVLKGPGFGGETSLICPYVLLAHYNDDVVFLKEHKLDLRLLRLSVGCEPVDDIWKGLGLS